MLRDEHRPDPPRHRRRRRQHVALWSAVLVPLAVLGAPVASYVTALDAPGAGDWQVATVEWLRDHGAGPVVDVAENVWYAHDRSSGAAPEPDTVPVPPEPALPVPSGAPAVQPASLPLLPGVTALPDEAAWIPNEDGGATPGLYTGWFRPDPAHPSQIVGVAWMNQDVVATHLFAGTAEPVGGTPAASAQVPPDLRTGLVATFNSGWKMRDCRGGFYAGGRAVVPLRDGAASLVIDASGRVTVGRWGRDVRPGRDVAAVRQNLDLIVDGGRPVAGLEDNVAGTWGNPKNQFQYTWRSGLGTDRTGNLIYVAGDQLTLAALAGAMTLAGVQRGMELDIHPRTVTFNVVHPTGGAAGARSHGELDATKLLPAMLSPATRYLEPDHRDFLAVTLRHTRP